ncbi:MAG: cytochrome c oxidase assembly protein subunit 15 [Alphaproteobacteria bacterium]|nr:cytochrome c oxidase assembly protein subunit 15 [Alphaproteobacteria bacterium]
MSMPLIPDAASSARRQIALWLFGLCGFIALVVLVGGLTRLTDSGLSITEWRPVTGIIPPLSTQDWQLEFFKYQQIPEYRLINRDMTLDEFKTIFWWEWAHRFLARVSGLVFLAPFIFFRATGRLGRAEVPKFLLLFLMGGAQGLLGWYMVKSGLSVRVDVSQYRLAAHLGLAFLVYSYAFWLGLNYWRETQGHKSPLRLRAGSALLYAALLLQILLGALVAGLDAGLSYNDWPLMDGYWVPPGLFQITPWYLNLFENITLVQFNHRMLGIIILALAMGLWMGRARGNLARAFNLLLLVIAGQFALGVWTLLSVAPVGLSAAHQIGALTSLSVAIWIVHQVWKPAG